MTCKPNVHTDFLSVEQAPAAVEGRVVVAMPAARVCRRAEEIVRGAEISGIHSGDWSA